jgi:hypothetical protein
MVAVAREYEYLIARAQKENKPKLVEQLSRAYEKYMDEVTS